MEIKNTIIKSVFVGREDYGIPTCNVMLDYGGSGQSFGGYDLRYVGHQMFLFEMMDVIGAADLSRLPGQSVRVKADHSKVHAIGHFIDDEWFDPNDYDGCGRGE